MKNQDEVKDQDYLKVFQTLAADCSKEELDTLLKTPLLSLPVSYKPTSSFAQLHKFISDGEKSDATNNHKHLQTLCYAGIAFTVLPEFISEKFKTVIDSAETSLRLNYCVKYVYSYDTDSLTRAVVKILPLTKLTSLDLSGNKISDEGAKALATNTTLKSLHLEDNLIGDEGIMALAANTTLTSLSLDRIGSGTTAKALAANTTLESLYMTFRDTNVINDIVFDVYNNQINVSTEDFMALQHSTLKLLPDVKGNQLDFGDISTASKQSLVGEEAGKIDCIKGDISMSMSELSKAFESKRLFGVGGIEIGIDFIAPSLTSSDSNNDPIDAEAWETIQTSIDVWANLGDERYEVKKALTETDPRKRANLGRSVDIQTEVPSLRRLSAFAAKKHDPNMAKRINNPDLKEILNKNRV